MSSPATHGAQKPSSPAYASQTSPPRRALMAQILITRDARKAKAAERDGAAASLLTTPEWAGLHAKECAIRDEPFVCVCVYVFSSL